MGLVNLPSTGYKTNYGGSLRRLFFISFGPTIKKDTSNYGTKPISWVTNHDHNRLLQVKLKEI